MKHRYNITGMTCNGCKASVEKTLLGMDGIDGVSVDLLNGTAEISMKQYVATGTFTKALLSKYNISEVTETQLGKAEILDKQYLFKSKEDTESQTKLEQLKPLFLIFGCILLITLAKHFYTFNISEAVLDFMGLFFFIFSLFKFFDLKGFSQSFSSYDPLAKAVPAYGNIYPFIEVTLGFLFLTRLAIPIVLVVTIVILGITTTGVVRSLLGKKTIQCACLGTVLNLPMTEATFIENAVMIVMSISMLTTLYI